MRHLPQRVLATSLPYRASYGMTMWIVSRHGFQCGVLILRTKMLDRIPSGSRQHIIVIHISPLATALSQILRETRMSSLITPHIKYREESPEKSAVGRLS